MSFIVLGFYPGKDALVFEQSINLTLQELMPVMHWENSRDHVGADFKLSTEQTVEIERLASLAMPRELDLYLTSNE
jgi:hypothetical protein